MEFEFTVPMQIELEIVEFCLNELKIPFGDFWYEWFNSNKEGNHSLKIYTCGVVDISREQLFKLSFIKRLFNTHLINLVSIGCQFDDINYVWDIRFSSVEAKK